MPPTFSGAELRLARIFNGLVLDDVAERVGKTRQYLHKLETGQASPTATLLSDLASALRVTPDFFLAKHTPAILEDQFHFRKLRSTSATGKQLVMARGEMLSRLVAYFDRELKLPPLKFPQASDVRSVEDIEQAAETCRREWALGWGPIASMVGLAEHAGAIVTTFPSCSKDIDALSVAVSRPIIVRSEAKESVCRHRFDIGHEIGHCVLHAGQVTGDRLTEGQANRFASAILVPRSMMARFFPRARGTRLDWKGLHDFKLIWKVSKAALLYRARQLDLITDAQYKSGVITLKRTGEATSEREDDQIAPEAPTFLYRAFAVLAERRHLVREDIAAAMGITPDLLVELVGFDLPSLTPGSNDSLRQRPPLYLVR